MLGKLPILVVEDQSFVALDLADAIRDFDGISVGPVSTVAEAMELLNLNIVNAAILDANLADGDVTSLALALIQREIPFVVYTGTGLPDELAQRHPDLPVIRKPASSALVLATLLQHLAPDLGLPTSRNGEGDGSNIT